MNLDVKMSGFDEVARRLRALPEQTGDRVQTNALRKGGAVIARAAAEKAPRSTKSREPHLADSMVVKVERNEARERVAFVGPSARAFWGRFVESGTAPHRQPKRRRDHPGTQARPFLRPAYEQTRGEALREIARAVERGIARAVRRMNKGSR